MKRVLFHYPILNVGGAEKSSLRMIKALCERGWNVTLVLTTGGGALEPEVDPRVKLVRLRPRAYGHRFARARGAVTKLRALPDLFGYGAMRLIGGLRMLPFLFRRYDAAITGIHSTSSDFIRKRVKSRTRIHWIRNDLLGVDPDGVMSERLRRADDGIDHYICVSEVARHSLITRVPQAEKKANVIYNILNAEEMRRLSVVTIDHMEIPKDEVPNILTVCRILDRDKAVFRIVRVAGRLRSLGHKFRWFIVGGGPDYDELKKRVVNEGLGDTVVLLGPKENPFPYYMASDIVAMVSYHEGLSGMINEAKICGRCVFATATSGVDEQIQDSVNGFVVENTEDAITSGLIALLENPDLVKTTSNTIYPSRIVNDGEKIDSLEALFLSANVHAKEVV